MSARGWSLACVVACACRAPAEPRRAPDEPTPPASVTGAASAPKTDASASPQVEATGRCDIEDPDLLELAGTAVDEAPSQVAQCVIEEVRSMPEKKTSPFSARVLDRETGTDAVGVHDFPEGRTHSLELFVGKRRIGSLDGRFSHVPAVHAIGSTHVFFFVLGHPADIGMTNAVVSPRLVAFPRAGGRGELVGIIRNAQSVAAAGDYAYVTASFWPIRRIHWKTRVIETAPNTMCGSAVAADEQGAYVLVGDDVVSWPAGGLPHRACDLGDRVPHYDSLPPMVVTKTHVYVASTETSPVYRFAR